MKDDSSQGNSEELSVLCFCGKITLTIQDLCFDQLFNQCISEVVTVLTYCYGLRERC